MGLTAPADLSEAEREVWDSFADDVRRLDLSYSVDVEVLRILVATVVEMRAAEAWVAENGTTYTTRDDKGNVRQVGEAPRYKQLRALRADFVRLAAAAGLGSRPTPAPTPAPKSTGGEAAERRAVAARARLG